MIGDVLTTSILFEILKKKYKDSQLHYVINARTYPVVENNPFIDKFHFVSPKMGKSKREFYKFLKGIKNENYDVVIDVYSKFSSNLMTLFSGANVRISKYKWYTSFLYSHTSKESLKANTNAGLAIENRLRLLEPLLKESAMITRPEVYLTNEEIAKARSILEASNIDFKQPLFMISVLGSTNNKTYPLDGMAKIIDTIVAETEAAILFNYIPNQEVEAKTVFEYCNEKSQRHIHLKLFGRSLREFLALTHHCTALVGNEGGAVNMAKAMNIPTFTIFSPWILKEAWNMFDDDNKHVSVHLKDVAPELYHEKSMKSVKKEVAAYYRAFSPDQIISKLKSFLKQRTF